MSNLTKCSINFCQNNGECFLNACNCTICYMGLLCEQEKYSQNLWELAVSNKNRFEHNSLIVVIGLFLIGLLSFVSNLLALQTYLCSHKIRITNLGVYLVLFSLGCLINTTIGGLLALLNFIGLVVPTNVVQCAVIRLLLNSIVFCSLWLNLYIAVERALIEYNVLGLYDSGRRSLILCLLLYILVPLSNVVPIVYGRKPNYDFCTLNLTPIGYFFYSSLYYGHYLLAPLALLISFICILLHLLKHRQNLVDEETIFESIRLVVNRHYAFSTPLLIFVVFVTPYFILGKVMTCDSADTSLVGKMTTIMRLLSNSVLALTFPMYVYSSSVYMNEFWQSSYCGRFLIYLKTRFWKNKSVIEVSVVLDRMNQ